MPRTCSFNHEGNRLYCLKGETITPLSKGRTVEEGTVVLSLPHRHKGSGTNGPEKEDFYNMLQEYPSYLHEMRNGNYRCSKTSAGGPKRAGPDKVTFLLRKYAAHNSMNDTLRQACEIQGANTAKDFANMRKAHRQTKNMGIDDFFVKIVHLGSVLDPTVTTLRKGPAVFSNGRTASSSENIKDNLRKLHGHLTGAEIPMPESEALEYYHAFEEIHPLRDGNGRIGMLLYNILIESGNDLKLPRDKPAWN